MILDKEQLTSIVIDNPNKAIIEKGRESTKKLRFHLYGENKDSYIETIEGFEKDKKLREKYTKSNKDLFARLGRPMDKVYSAKGGSIYYNLSDSQEKTARLLSNSLQNGLPIKKWVQNVWQAHMLDDPFGITLMEILPKQEAILAKQNNQSFVYPTYKSITTIYDYLPKGNKLEYVVFNLSAAEKKMLNLDDKGTFYRVIDDAFDYIVKKEDKNVTIIDKLTLINYFGYVPAMVNSDISDPKNEYCVLSFYDEIVELADQFLLKNSIKSIHDFYHGFPKYSEFASDCNNCGGSRYVDGHICSECKGTGLKIMSKVSDNKLLKWPDKGEVVVMPSDVGGYISPDKTYWEISTTDLQSLEDAMCVTLWGKQSSLKTQGTSINQKGSAKTATEIMDDIKPEADRLHIISEMAEKRHKFILDAIIKVQVSPFHQGCSVNYGRRYMIEGPDAIWEKYANARSTGAPQNVLDDLLNEYYDSKYQSDPIGLAIAKKMMYVEPFVHYAPAQLKSLDPSPEDYKAKLYFGEWLSTVDEGALISMSIAELKESLNVYASTKKLTEPKQLQPAA